MGDNNVKFEGSNWSLVDQFMDYVPFVSIISNAIDQGMKIKGIAKEKLQEAKNPVSSSTTPIKQHYWTHIENKSGWRLFFGCIPGIGNAILLGADLIRGIKYLSVRWNPKSLKNYKKDPDFQRDFMLTITDPKDREKYKKYLKSKVQNEFFGKDSGRTQEINFDSNDGRFFDEQNSGEEGGIKVPFLQVYDKRGGKDNPTVKPVPKNKQGSVPNFVYRGNRSFFERKHEDDFSESVDEQRFLEDQEHFEKGTNKHGALYQELDEQWQKDNLGDKLKFKNKSESSTDSFESSDSPFINQPTSRPKNFDNTWRTISEGVDEDRPFDIRDTKKNEEYPKDFLSGKNTNSLGQKIDSEVKPNNKEDENVKLSIKEMFHKNYMMYINFEPQFKFKTLEFLLKCNNVDFIQYIYENLGSSEQEKELCKILVDIQMTVGFNKELLKLPIGLSMCLSVYKDGEEQLKSELFEAMKKDPATHPLFSEILFNIGSARVKELIDDALLSQKEPNEAKIFSKGLGFDFIQRVPPIVGYRQDERELVYPRKSLDQAFGSKPKKDDSDWIGNLDKIDTEEE